MVKKIQWESLNFQPIIADYRIFTPEGKSIWNSTSSSQYKQKLFEMDHKLKYKK